MKKRLVGIGMAVVLAMALGGWSLAQAAGDTPTAQTEAQLSQLVDETRSVAAQFERVEDGTERDALFMKLAELQRERGELCRSLPAESATVEEFC